MDQAHPGIFAYDPEDGGTLFPADCYLSVNVALVESLNWPETAVKVIT